MRAATLFVIGAFAFSIAMFAIVGYEYALEMDIYNKCASSNWSASFTEGSAVVQCFPDMTAHLVSLNNDTKQSVEIISFGGR